MALETFGEAVRSRFIALAAPTPPEKIQWRQDGKPIQRGGKYFARFVAYIDAGFVRQRLDSLFAGEWHTALTVLPERGDEDGVAEVSIKYTLTILGLSRESIGAGANYKSADSDGLKRAAVRFGVAADLYDLDVNWVGVDGDAKFAKPVEDPGEAYARKQQQQRKGRDGAAVPPTARVGVGEAVSPSPAAPAPKPAPKEAPKVTLPASSSAAARQAINEGFPDALRDPYQDGLPF